MELTENQVILIERTIKDLIPDLKSKPNLLHLRQSAFDYYSSETAENFQIHVTVTRDENDFLDFLQIEEMS